MVKQGLKLQETHDIPLIASSQSSAIGEENLAKMKRLLGAR